MKKNRIELIVTILLNGLGISLLIACAIPYLTHDMTISNAMWDTPRWDGCGFLLMWGVIPLTIVNVQTLKSLKRWQVKLPWRALCLLPCIVCFGLVAHYFGPVAHYFGLVAHYMIESISHIWR